MSKGVREVLYYHERKLRIGAAELLSAGNFLESTQELSYKAKLARFKNLMELNSRAEFKILRATLGFHPLDKEKLGPGRMRDISVEYLQRIGFTGQPYLVYAHYDSAHPHLHLVTCLIRPDGSRIKTHFLGVLSGKVRKEIEQVYGLSGTDKKDQANQAVCEKHSSPGRLEYGKSLYRQGIARVVNWVLEEYSISNLTELNAILGEYRVIATCVKVNSISPANRGLVYAMLNDSNKPVGKAIHASGIESRPTLANLEIKFQANEGDRASGIKRLQTVISWTLAGRKISLDEFEAALAKENIVLVKKAGGFIYIDHERKTVLEDKNLGTEYTRDAIARQLMPARELTVTNIRIKDLDLSR
ncbi:MAG TPA: relaxase/mobilization nuclease domain-containing protein [Puia sp.]|nr:relaxase/mobilization nuclease domain-containing protein [Puia sp.]